jgi:hypothetical protein
MAILMTELSESLVAYSSERIGNNIPRLQLRQISKQVKPFDAADELND